MKCSVLEGRDSIPKVIELTKKLVADENYYVVHMVTFALAQLAAVRLTVLPENRNTLFFNDDKEKALKMAKEVESLAFNLLDRLLSWSPTIQNGLGKSVLHVFDPLRALNEKDGLRLLTSLSKLPNKIIDEAAPLFIYFAELRKHNYSKWKFSALGLYDDLGPDKYDEKKFKKIVVDTITRVENEDPDACFHFAASIEYLVRETPAGGDGIKSYALLSLEYFDLLTNKYGHTIFNLVYQVIGTKLNADDKFTEIWFQLFIKCLKIETAYFEKEKEAGNLPKIYWYPSLYNSQTLETIYHKLGKDKFMEAAKILFSAPREIELNESSELVEIIRELSKDNSEAQKIIDYLIQKNTSKYWYLTKK